MRDEHVGFFVVMAVLVPFVLVMLAVHWLLGTVATAIVLVTAYETKQQEWAQLGNMIDAQVITIAVLIGGTLLILEQGFG